MTRGRLLTAKEAGERLGGGERFARRLIAERRIPVVRLGENGKRGAVRIAESDLDDYIEQHREAVTPAKRHVRRAKR